jgi:hypothetical protein
MRENIFWKILKNEILNKKIYNLLTLIKSNDELWLKIFSLVEF